MDKVFQKQKRTNLSKTDFSRKGSIDEPIVDLIHYINGLDRFFTTSSCSGRICIFEENPDVVTKKKGCIWLYSTHEKCELDKVIASLKDSKTDAVLKFEPFVLHVQCCSVQDAQILHCSAISSGFRNSGISIAKSGKIISAVRSTHSLEVPLTRKGQTVVSPEYIEFIVELANNKMKENLSRVQGFFDCFRNALQSLEKTGETPASNLNSKCKSINSNKPICEKCLKRIYIENDSRQLLTSACKSNRDTQESITIEVSQSKNSNMTSHDVIMTDDDFFDGNVAMFSCVE